MLSLVTAKETYDSPEFKSSYCVSHWPTTYGATDLNLKNLEIGTVNDFS